MVKEKLFFTPAPGFILVEPIEETGKLAYASQDKEPPKKGKVLAVGESYTTEFNADLFCPCDVGDIIAHTTIGYEEIKYGYKLYRVIPFTKIIGKYEN